MAASNPSTNPAGPVRRPAVIASPPNGSLVGSLTSGTVRLLCGACALALASCAAQSGSSAKWASDVLKPAPLPPGLNPADDDDVFASTYRSTKAEPVAIVNARILSAAGPRIEGGTLLIRDGKVAAIGKDIAVPSGTRVIDAAGRYVTPGIIDPHSHIGAGSSPSEGSGDASNEKVNPAGVLVENSIWAQDPMFDRTLAAGVTTLQILPGSANTFNGRSVILKNVPALDVKGKKFPGVAGAMKIACGENPGSGQAGKSSTRAGVMRDFRTALAGAAEYSQRWENWRKQGRGDAPKRDIAQDNLAGMLTGKLRVQIHCYRADEMLQMIDLSHEFGFKIAAFHHATEAFKIAARLTQETIGVVTWAGDWAGYKMEAYDAIMETPAFVEAEGGLVAMHSDDVQLGQHLNQEASRSATAGREAGIAITDEDAIRWVTINPAKIIGVDKETGSLEVGKMADVVLWDTNPFSVYALPDLVFIDGVLLFDRSTAYLAKPRSDYELGNVERREPKAYPVPRWENEK